MAFGDVCGAALVLDADLRVLLSTAAAEELLGFDVPLGASAPKLLCGQAMKRPLAEALAEGRPVQAVIPRPRPGAESQLVRVRATPLGAAGARSGWLLFLQDAAGALADGEVLFHGMWTQDAGMKQVFRIVERVADSDVTVLVRGETGSGKELVASALHALSPRRRGPFRALNCAALPANLLESELFGHARGAFTGATRDAPGHIQLAEGGTLFLDEVAELPLELQAKLLRVLEVRAVIPVGAREPIPVDVRVISATHRPLRKEVEAGRFRADLMYRLRVIPIFLPPLRARPGDVMLLCAKLMDDLNTRRRRRIESVAPAAERALASYDWPGNVRELKNVLEYAYAIGEGPVLALSDLPPEIVEPALSREEVQGAPPPRGSGLAEDAEAAEEAARILRALERSAGNRERAAQILGTSRVTLWRRMKALGLLD
ncbi:MAG: sigma 54-interacting transcriptional regulator [Polyangiaceae bacterium]|nr:sigma 54-interacting transcriptional regulator [Polyangiaceae bacterium]